LDDEPPLHRLHEAAQGWHVAVVVFVHWPDRYWPAGHDCVHCVQLLAPGAEANVPAAHTWQLAAFDPVLYVPGEQSAQVRSDVTVGASASNCPATHASQPMHAACPGCGWNWPVEHVVHADCSPVDGEKEPALQLAHTVLVEPAHVPLLRN